jgi:hypothetical protein
MKYVDEFRNPELTTQLLHELEAATTGIIGNHYGHLPVVHNDSEKESVSKY